MDETKCPVCGERMRAERHQGAGGRYGSVEYVDFVCDGCGYVDMDEAGGV